MKKLIYLILAVVLVAAGVYFKMALDKKEISDALGEGLEGGYQRSEESKESSRRSIAEFRIEQQKSEVKLQKELYKISKSDDQLRELERAKDKLERLEEAEENRR